MTRGGQTPHDESSEQASVDDWEAHWSEYADSASDNPAQAYRRLLIMRLLHREGEPARILDIGSGQGDLLAALGARWPAAELTGIEPSAEGIRRATEKVPRARFLQLDLLKDHHDSAGLRNWADVAVCSEVIEHVDEPSRLLRAAARFVTRGGLLVVTVPGGPRTAFDRHIGHRRHYRPASLRAVLEQADLDVERVMGAGFPFFNIYKMMVLLRGRALVRDVSTNTEPSRLAAAVMRTFGFLLEPGLNGTRFGWQLVAVARVRARSSLGTPPDDDS